MLRPTLLALRQVISDAAGFSIDDLDAGLRALRVAGRIPLSKPGRGGAGSPETNLTQAIDVLLAVLIGEEPRHLPARIDEVKSWVLVAVNSMVLEPAGVALITHPESVEVPLTFGEVLAFVIEGQRFMPRPLASPVELTVGRRYGRSSAVLTVQSTLHINGTSIIREFGFAPLGTEPGLTVSDAANATLTSVRAIGGNVLTRIAQLFGPRTDGLDNAVAAANAAPEHIWLVAGAEPSAAVH